MNVPKSHMTAMYLLTVSTLQARTTVYATSQDIAIMAACVQVCFVIVLAFKSELWSVM